MVGFLKLVELRVSFKSLPTKAELFGQVSGNLAEKKTHDEENKLADNTLCHPISEKSVACQS